MENITITLTRYKEPNWLFHETLLALSKQEKIRAIVLVLDQFFHAETKKFCKNLNNSNIVFSYIKIAPKNLCYARNFAIKNTKTDILLYIDTDAVPDREWSYELTKSLLKENIGVGGGKIVPRYLLSPIYISKYERVKNIYSLLDLGNDEIFVNKIVGANFGINLKNIGNNVFFDERFGRKDGHLISGEESDFCERVFKLGFKICYNGSAIVEHQILPERISYFWVWKRLYYQGVTKSITRTPPKITSGKLEKKGIIYYIILLIFSIPRIIGYIHGLFKYKLQK